MRFFLDLLLLVACSRPSCAVVIGLLVLYLLLYVLARFFASYTTWLQDNETQLASSLTLKLTSRDGTPSHRRMWKAIWFGGWAGRQVIASGSLRRFVTAEFREIFSLVAWFSLVGTVAVEWPGFACAFVLAHVDSDPPLT